MSVTIHRKHLRETPFFEISGLPGRLYLESFSFGDSSDPLDRLESQQSSGGVVRRSLEQSPLTLFPDPKKVATSIILRTLRRLRSDSFVYQIAEKIDTCSIGTEWLGEGGLVTTTIYMLFKCDLGQLRRFGVNDRFQIEFGHVHRVGTFLSKESW